MILEEYCEKVTVQVNSVDIDVPYGILYLTVNLNGVMQGWTKIPVLDLGYWGSEECEPIKLAYVEMEDDDTRWVIFDVRRNCWYNRYDY